VICQKRKTSRENTYQLENSLSVGVRLGEMEGKKKETKNTFYNTHLTPNLDRIQAYWVPEFQVEKNSHFHI